MTCLFTHLATPLGVLLAMLGTLVQSSTANAAPLARYALESGRQVCVLRAQPNAAMPCIDWLLVKSRTGSFDPESRGAIHTASAEAGRPGVDRAEPCLEGQGTFFDSPPRRYLFCVLRN